MNLQSHALRLASSLPGGKFRDALIATVKEATESKWQNTVAGEKARIRWNDHPKGNILIEEMPVKGKKRLRRAEWSPRQLFGYDQPDAFMSENITRTMRPSPSMSYDQAVQALKNALAEAVAYVESGKDHHRKELHLYERTQISKAPIESDVFYLEVEPSDYSPMSIQGKDFVMKVEWGEFEAFSPNSDFQQSDPHYSVKEQKSPGAARKLYKILKADPTALQSVGWYALGDWLDKNGIGYETHHSQWR